LDDDAKRRRYKNKLRILRHFNATDFEWTYWKWQVRHIIKDANTLSKLIKLTDKEYEAVELVQKYKIPFGITPYYLSLMDNEPDQGRDTAIRAQVIPSLHYIKKLKEHKASEDSSMDFMLERDTSPIEGITRRYPQIAILKPVMTCPQICVYCQRNWEIEDVYSSTAFLPKPKLEKALAWLERGLNHRRRSFPPIQRKARKPALQALQNEAHQEDQTGNSNTGDIAAEDY
jgi:lysine 2,3-aminomutase